MKLNRRQLIGRAAVMAAMPGIPSAFAAVKEETRDLVIVGGGLGGLSAANAAVNKGCKALVIEKLPFSAAQASCPKARSASTRSTRRPMASRRPPSRSSTPPSSSTTSAPTPPCFASSSRNQPGTIDEIIDMGVELRGIRTMYPKEESLMCWHLFKGGTAEVIRRWIENIKARGGELLTNTRVTKLIMTDGRVTGVEATTKSGDKLIIHAKKVIIATGGFAANKEMLAQYVFDSSALGMVEPIWLRSPVVDGRTGDGINMARLVGAGVAGMHAVAGNAPYLPDTPPINQFSGPDELKQGRCALAQPWLWVDHTGRRFFNESRGSVFVDVYNAMTTAGGVSYTIFDQKMMDRMINKGAVLPFNAIVLADTPLKALPKTWEIGKERGWAFKADSIEELAQQIGVPPENLKDTMKKVNGLRRKGTRPRVRPQARASRQVRSGTRPLLRPQGHPRLLPHARRRSSDAGLRGQDSAGRRDPEPLRHRSGHRWSLRLVL